MTRRLLPVLVLCLSCAKPPAEAPGAPDASVAVARPRAFEPLERVLPDAGPEDPREALYRVVPFTPVGPAVPAGALLVELDGDHALVAGRALDVASLPKTQVVVLVPVGETYLAQAAATLAQLDDAQLEVWFKHPDAALAYPVDLRDEPTFQAWIDEAVPGKLRVIHREDGFELQTNLGKLPGGDPNGPTVPVRGGVMDLTTLQRGLSRVQLRFKAAPDYCLVPSFGLPLADVARAMAPNYAKADSTFFAQTCLVYPRPRPRDAGH
jgi:hypothetical protein